MAGAPGNVPQFASLYVGDLHPDVTEAMLYEIFNSVGPVGSIRVCRNSVTRKSLGYAYVNFHNVADAERALDTLNFTDIKGRACRIMWSQRDPSLRKSGVGNIFVKNLNPSIDNKALYDTFSLFGNILSCKVSVDHNGKSRGYGFVHFETEEAAKQAIERVNGMEIGDHKVEVTMVAKKDEKSDPSHFTNLYVKNFPQDWSEDKLMELFKPVGEITSSVVMSDKLGRKFAFVNYASHEHAQKAIEELKGKDLRSDEQKAAQKPEDNPDDFLLYVGKHQTKAERARELSGGKGGSKDGVNLYVKNLDEEMDDATLKELFEPFGTVTSSCIMKDDRGKCKGFGFVCYSTADEATKAVTDMHLKVVKGKPLYVGLSERKEVRQERLRMKYSGPPGGGAGKGGGGGKGGGMMGGPQGMPGPMNPMMRGPMPGFGGKPGGFPMGFGGKPGMMMGGPMMMGMKGGMPPMMMGGKGPMGMGTMMPQMMMRPMMMPGMKGGFGMPMPGQTAPLPTAAPAPGGAPISAASLAAATPQAQKQMLGEKLFMQISKYHPDLAGKITGMMLEMDNSELLILLESEQQLKAKVDEALRVLNSK
eukprot:SRR837773.16550.p2 GENE.SRR837773.16550~~SRR837773.16550.p2  ORF type:complete len:589 (+),score=308.82 SRR837773.16550:25-1791(+)